MTITTAPAEAADLSERLERLARPLLGKPYATSPLGEGPTGEFDQDPLIRLDRFDCTTLVETLLAMAVTTGSDPLPSLTEIRYGGRPPSFVDRLHWPETSWVTAQARSGLLRDVTGGLGGEWVRKGEARVDRASWFARLPLAAVQVDRSTPADRRRRLQRLRALGRGLAPQVASLAYLPWPAWNDPTLLARLPDAAVLDVVAARGAGVAIAHQAILIRRQGRLLVVHASTLRRRVVSVPLASFVAGFNKYGKYKGLQVLAIRISSSSDASAKPGSGVATP